MDGWGSIVTAALAFTAAGLFGATGVAAGRRDVSPEVRVANGAYALAWYGLATMMATDGVRLALSAFPQPSLDLYVAMMQVKIVAMATMLGAFGSYVLFLYRGSLRGAIGFGGFATIHALYFLYGLQLRLPIEIVTGTWGGRAAFLGDGALPGGLFLGLVMFFVPLLVLAGAYAWLLRRAPQENRARLLSVVLALVLFAVAGSVQADPSVSPDGPMLPLAGLALLAAAAVAARSFITNAATRKAPAP